MGVRAKEISQKLPDEATQQRAITEIDQMMQHLPDCPDQVMPYQNGNEHCKFFPILAQIVYILNILCESPASKSCTAA